MFNENLFGETYERRRAILKFLKPMRRSSTEIVYFRAQAYFLAGLCHFSDWDREAQAVKYFDKAPWLYGSANEAKKNRWNRSSVRRKPGKNASTGKPAADPRATFDKVTGQLQRCLVARL
eukprot:scaffold10252_cov76-Amphora_coffeaeformis.AAC.1